MKRGENPLYPESNDEGLIGRYEEAAFIDDTEEMFSEEKIPYTSRNAEFYPSFAARRHAYRRFSEEISQQNKDRKEQSKLLKAELKSGRISRRTYRRLKRVLVRYINHTNWQCYLKFLKGDFYD